MFCSSVTHVLIQGETYGNSPEKIEYYPSHSWIGLNAFGLTKFDVYPFILLNLAFSLQAAYAAPLILLAQTRQADRDKAHADADAQHREALALASEQRQTYAVQQSEQLLALLQQNTQLTELVKELSQRIEVLTSDMHSKVIQDSKR